MKFAIPLADGKLTPHFGHCQEFALIDVEDKQIKNKEFLVPPPHEPGVLPKWLRDLEANVIIAGGMGDSSNRCCTEAVRSWGAAPAPMTSWASSDWSRRWNWQTRTVSGSLPM